MIALAGGGIAALMWGLSTILAGRASRQIGPSSTLAWVGAGGLVLILPIVAWYGVRGDWTWTNVALLIYAGLSSAIGLRFTYAALARGKVGLVVAITSTEGAIAAVIAVLLGETIGWLAAAGIVMAAAGVSVVGLGRHDDDTDAVVRDNRRAAVSAGGAAVIFGTALYVSGDIAQKLGGPWVVLSARLTGLLTMGLPLVLRRELQWARPGLWFALAAGLCESIGFLGFLWGAGDGIAVAAVMATQYATVATLLSWVLLRERLSRTQLAGVTVVILGVVAISLSGSL